MSTPSSADLLIRAAAVHTLAPGEPPQRAIAVTGGRITALSPAPDGLDALAGPATEVVDAPGATVLPAFDDTHAHLIMAGHSVHGVPVHEARDLAAFLRLIRERAARTPAGRWITTTVNWQEVQLAEQRLPTTEELDTATTDHPVLVRRGAYNMVLNSAALRLAGITDATEAPPGGVIERDAHGRRTGRLINRATELVDRVLPRPTLAERIDGLRAASAAFAATGIGTVRDCLVPVEDLDVLHAARAEGALAVRVRALVSGFATRTPEQVDALLDRMDEWTATGRDDDQLRLWGVKFGIDGGFEAGAVEEPYAGQPCFHGRLLWEPAELVAAVDRVVARGRRVGVHAWGDRGLRVLLDVFEQVLKHRPDLPPGTLVVEHGGLARADQRARAIALGIPVTVQHPLLHDGARTQQRAWGEARTAALFPLREWLDEGGRLSAGSDFPIGPYGAMLSVWGMTTRRTTAGVLGPEHAITRAEAIALHTVEAARLTGESTLRGSLRPGALADLTLWPADPLTCPVDGLRDLKPVRTVINGRTVHAA
ncbi:amidohydrolase [Streptomyces rubellomurinus]|uniref:Amidohydrolase n=1 Tax=Streptomyces rubellomurinus (strain ATCC 31215) TaxID=359131 RepID=A0A0F2TGG2_STRR3|nr:amidohydrolase [Streptomyces rubellomurinus]KJS61631.1 amidohydrolase [Streptomyces rubellomurinus]